MKFQLLKQEYKGVSVPKIVFDNLLIARETDLKVALYILNNNTTDAITISQELNLNMIAVQSSLLFWANAGLLSCIEEKEEKIKKTRMSAVDIINIKKTVPEIGILITQIQNVFGSTLNEKNTIKFIELFLEENIPIDAIITLSHYYYNKTKQNPSYISKVISSSHKKYNFSSAQKAEEYISLIELREINYQKVAVLFSTDAQLLNSSEKTVVNFWFEKLNMSFEMIKKSYEVAGSNADIKYCNGILKNWHRKKYTTIQDLEKEIINSQPNSSGSSIKPEDDLLIKAALTVPTFE